MTMAGFRINFPRVMSQASEIEYLSVEYHKEISKLENMLSLIHI